MKNYIAIETFFNADGIPQLKIAGFGKTENLETVRRMYQLNIDVFEIDDKDLQILRGEK